MSAPKHVLFVCTGNTCRSPMAEALFRSAAAGRDDLTVGSAGVAASNGLPASPDARHAVKKRGASLKDFKSRPVTADLLESATHVFAMTEGHLAALESRFPEFADKYYLVGEFAGTSEQRRSTDVPDPIGMGRAAYEEVAHTLANAIPAIIAYLDAEPQA